MKNIITGALLLLLSELVYSDTFFVGGKKLDIPAPNGFERVTQQMDALYRYWLSIREADLVNNHLAFYIPESDVPAAMAGEIPSFERWYVLMVNKGIKDMVIGFKKFDELKSIIKHQNKEIFDSIETQLPGFAEKINKGVNKEFDVDIALKLHLTIPLDSHYETDNSIHYSLYGGGSTSMEKTKKDFIFSGTVAVANVAGKILFLYCYGPQEYLEWTRNASKNWADAVMNSNSPPPLRSSGSGGIDWEQVFAKGIVGGIVGLILGLVLWIFRSFKNRKS